MRCLILRLSIAALTFFTGSVASFVWQWATPGEIAMPPAAVPDSMAGLPAFELRVCPVHGILMERQSLPLPREYDLTVCEVVDREASEAGRRASREQFPYSFFEPVRYNPYVSSCDAEAGSIPVEADTADGFICHLCVKARRAWEQRHNYGLLCQMGNETTPLRLVRR
ncbi:MAG: hypothetical protein LC754_05780 [Acidobacteria bacterium]|nr:hypothetical protein [Acidobacteriota bacterium]